ncbi:MAG: ABC transporter ATP-binding protein [Acidipila sp.]|nr:ABC transporter ATP-binding protein [Acidipila sp.]
MEKLLQVRDLTIDYCSAELRTHRAVAGASFDIAPGEVVGLMGESGCGKTSIALALLNVLPKDRTRVTGSILFRGQELLTMRETSLRKIRGAALSIIFQEPEAALSPVMRVGNQIAEVIHAHRRWSWKRCRDEAASAIAAVGLPATERIYLAYPHQLSGGQRQRIVLAQALACEPALVIADEPTASLDAQSQADFLVLLRNLKSESNVSVLLISHSPEVQASLADRLLVMQSGKIAVDTAFANLNRHPSHAGTRTVLHPNRRPEVERVAKSALVSQGSSVR